MNSSTLRRAAVDVSSSNAWPVMRSMRHLLVFRVENVPFIIGGDGGSCTLILERAAKVRGVGVHERFASGGIVRGSRVLDEWRRRKTALHLAAPVEAAADPGQKICEHG